MVGVSSLRYPDLSIFKTPQSLLFHGLQNQFEKMVVYVLLAVLTLGSSRWMEICRRLELHPGHVQTIQQPVASPGTLVGD